MLTLRQTIDRLEKLARLHGDELPVEVKNCAGDYDNIEDEACIRYVNINWPENPTYVIHICAY